METRLHGGPGAGKTTALAARIAAAAERTDRLLAVSLTRTAATRLVYEGLPLDREQVGTLHSVCYRALGRPELVERHIAEWNQEHYGYRLTVPRVDFEGGGDAPAGGKATHADGLRARYDLARARMTTSVWPGVADFARTWEAWKKAKGYDDFTDLIAKAPPTAPGDPVAIYVDEAQDHSPLELDLLRRWGRAAGELTLAGDADQSIYDWRGADAHAFLDPRIAAEDVVLPQSYRVPRTVHAAARVLMYNVRDRAPATAAPRDADGRAGWYDHTWKYAEAVPWALRDRPEGSVMLLASCAYMLAPAAAVMQQRGIPFHNPYRPLEGRWNPLGTRATTAVAAFLRPRADVWGAEARAWTVADMAKWAAVLRPEFLHHPGAAIDLKSRRGKDAQAPAVPEEWLSAAALEELTPADPFALWRAATRADQARLRYPLDVVVKSGPEALRARPRVVLGTIHSVKGAEADTVIVFPDLSPAASRSYHTRDGHDSVHRQMYVGLTRTRQTLLRGRAVSMRRVSL